MAKKKRKQNFPNPNPQPAGTDGETWKRWNNEAKQILARLFVSGELGIRYREWSKYQDANEWAQFFDPIRFGENCRKFRDDVLIKQLHQGGYLDTDCTDWAEGKRPETPEDIDALVKYILGMCPCTFAVCLLVSLLRFVLLCFSRKSHALLPARDSSRHRS